MKIKHLKNIKTLISNSYLIRQSFQGYRCKSALLSLHGGSLEIMLWNIIIDQCVKRLLEDEDYEIKHLEDLAIPTPQDSEQADHEDHSPHPPSSTRSAFIKSQLPLMHLLSTLLQQMEQREGMEIRQKIVRNPQFFVFLDKSARTYVANNKYK